MRNLVGAVNVCPYSSVRVTLRTCYVNSIGNIFGNALWANRKGGRIWLCSPVNSRALEIQIYFHILMVKDNLKSRQAHGVRKMANET